MCVSKYRHTYTHNKNCLVNLPAASSQESICHFQGHTYMRSNLFHTLKELLISNFPCWHLSRGVKSLFVCVRVRVYACASMFGDLTSLSIFCLFAIPFLPLPLATYSRFEDEFRMQRTETVRKNKKGPKIELWTNCIILLLTPIQTETGYTWAVCSGTNGLCWTLLP